MSWPVDGRVFGAGEIQIVGLSLAPLQAQERAETIMFDFVNPAPSLDRFDREHGNLGRNERREVFGAVTWLL
jgi:hypothetical protein